MTSAIRYRVAEELEKLNSPGDILHVASARSTWSMYGDTVERLRVWEMLIEQFLSEQSDVAADGELFVVTAGPPGAGKSTAVDALGPEYARCRRIDPDRVKELLIQRAVEDRIYEQFLQRTLADGRPIMPMELAGLVHEESVRVADEIRTRCLRVGENVLLEGTLSWDGLLDVYVRDLGQYGYERLGIVSVEVPIDVALQRAVDRWWLARSDAGNLNGGRFVPRAAIAACYTDSGRTQGSVNAAELARRAQRAGFSVQYEAVSEGGASGGRIAAAVSEDQNLST
jgi:adenylate kinase family enzyme